ncbi:putative type II toxin-antitoxin system HicA family toxin [Mycobacterium phage Y10]|uniref:Putative type II toxin-antitoxin system HicA family toxin n=1 Tax=Mycobacterium phage Y10 TaxID=2072010 RepID=A0A2Z5XAS5_9CAUD|nr:HicA-like toxin [Mycobacterium phage JF1]BBC43346.1 putative type II toxin-antitoxin system HicA family toxin [Mycobacterium phage Y10]BBC43437.1 putative type II toxin-antitoxin system HicA family toxin [Mycobacterium phage Y2]BBC43528.1 putative type II toxin-antitoxin system HicA family toxin [Mycobacterium phage Y10]
MKRSQVLTKIGKAAKAAGASFELEREGSNHALYRLDGVLVPIGRHPTGDLPGGIVRRIFKQCEPSLGKDWWRG